MPAVPSGAWWIGSSHPFDLHEVYLDFRRDVALERAPRTAKLTITADSRYRLWINGAYVGRGPARSWPHAQQFDVIDVRRHLVAGTNRIAIQVYSPGYSHFAYLHRGACGVLAWLDLDGETATATDANWRVQRDASWRDDVRRISIYGGGVERRAMALDTEWQTADVAAWAAARIVAAPNGPIWSNLHERDVPLLDEALEPLKTPFLTSGGAADRLADDPHDALRAAMSATSATPGFHSGDTCRVWALDLGHSRIGVGVVDVEDAEGGERVLVSYAEKRRSGAIVISDPATYCRMRPTDEFVLRPGSQRLEPFSQRGGRILIVAAWSARPLRLKVASHLRSTSYPIASRATPPVETSLAPVAALCARTTLACLQDGFVDSIWRESSQWLGDCVAQSFALAAISDDLRPLRRAIVMAAEGAYADGVLPSVLPGEVHAYAVTDYNFSWIELVHAYVRERRAPDGAGLLAEIGPVIDRLLAHFESCESPEGWLRPEPGRRLFLDWAPMDRGEPSLTYNGRYLHALRLAAGLARSPTEAQRLSAKAARLAKVIAATFRAHDEWRESPAGAAASQLGLALLILNDVMRGEAASAAADRVVARSLDPAPQDAPGRLVLASPFMHHYVFLALDHIGRGADILKIIKARWGAMSAQGEPTTWENWSIDFPDGSACHGFSAHPLGWIHRLAGRADVCGRRD